MFPRVSYGLSCSVAGQVGWVWGLVRARVATQQRRAACRVGSASGRCCLRAGHQPEVLEHRLGGKLWTSLALGKRRQRFLVLLATCTSVLGCMDWPPATSHRDTTGSDGEQSCARQSGQRVLWDVPSACCWEIIHPCQLGGLRPRSVLALDHTGRRATAST